MSLIIAIKIYEFTYVTSKRTLFHINRGIFVRNVLTHIIT